MVQLMPLPPHCLLSHENREWFYLSGAGLPRLSSRKKPLNWVSERLLESLEGAEDSVTVCDVCGTAVMQFSRLVMSERVIRRLLNQDVVVSVSVSDPECQRTLYKHGKPADYFTLILEGHVQIHIGSEEFVFDGGPFMYFGAQALTGTHVVCFLVSFC